MNFWQWAAKLLGMKAGDYKDPISIATANEKRIYFDVDNTIRGFDGSPIQEAIDFINDAHAAGFETWVYSCRTNPGPMTEIWCAEMLPWLALHKVRFTGIWGMRFENGQWVFHPDVGKPLGYILDDFSFQPNTIGLKALRSELKI